MNKLIVRCNSKAICCCCCCGSCCCCCQIKCQSTFEVWCVCVCLLECVYGWVFVCVCMYVYRKHFYKNNNNFFL